MNRDAVLRRKAEIEREFAEIQATIDGWRDMGEEVKRSSMPVRDRKKRAPTAVARRAHREEKRAEVAAIVAKAIREAPERKEPERKEPRFSKPVWVDRVFAMRDGGRRRVRGGRWMHGSRFPRDTPARTAPIEWLTSLKMLRLTDFSLRSGRWVLSKLWLG